MNKILGNNGLFFTLALLAVGGVGFILFNQNRLNSQIVEKQKITKTLEQVGHAIKVKALSYQDWERTKAWPGNASLQCVRAGSDCTGQGGDLVLIDREGVELSASASSRRGYDREGKPCAPFGKGGCVISVSLKWEPVCPGSGGCKNPQLRITPTFAYSGPSFLGGLNMERFNESFLVGGAGSGGGTGARGMCPAGQYVSGLQNGLVQCAALPVASSCGGTPPDCTQVTCKFGIAMLGCAASQWLCVCAR